jgi:hypothetical protein
MVKTIKKCNADYLIWFKPYSYIESVNGSNIALPKIVIYKLNNQNIDTIQYDTEYMISSEI